MFLRKRTEFIGTLVANSESDLVTLWASQGGKATSPVSYSGAASNGRFPALVNARPISFPAQISPSRESSVSGTFFCLSSRQVFLLADKVYLGEAFVLSLSSNDSIFIRSQIPGPFLALHKTLSFLPAEFQNDLASSANEPNIFQFSFPPV